MRNLAIKNARPSAAGWLNMFLKLSASMSSSFGRSKHKLFKRLKSMQKIFDKKMKPVRVPIKIKARLNYCKKTGH